MQQTLFDQDQPTAVEKGAAFSDCGRYRFALWRFWDKSLPFVMFIGLNPSKADATEDDRTIESVCRIAKNNGYGGVYMMNCFPFVSTNPDELWNLDRIDENEKWMKEISTKCADVVFAWGNFDVVKKLGVDYILQRKFPGAKALKINKSGAPKHPLYCKGDTKFITYESR